MLGPFFIRPKNSILYDRKLYFIWKFQHQIFIKDSSSNLNFNRPGWKKNCIQKFSQYIIQKDLYAHIITLYFIHFNRTVFGLPRGKRDRFLEFLFPSLYI